VYEASLSSRIGILGASPPETYRQYIFSVAVYPTWQLAILTPTRVKCNASNASAQIFNLYVVKHVTLVMLQTKSDVMLYIMSAAHTDGHLDTPPL
jgi:hypothetical protein